MRYAKHAMAALIIVLASIWQISLIAALPWPLSGLNLVLSVLIFINIIIDHKSALALAILAGLIVDMYSILPFGIITGTLLLVLVVTDALFVRFFTNRSLYSLLLLGLAGSFLYVLLTGVSMWAVFWIRGLGPSPVLAASALAGSLWQLLLNALVLLLFYALFRIFSKKLRSTFVPK